MRDASTSAVLFDFGNTLFAHASLADTICDAGQTLGHDITPGWASDLAARVTEAAHQPSELAHPRDLDDRVWFERWHLLYAMADDEVSGLGEAVYRSMHHPGSWMPYARTAATLDALHSDGIRVGIVSNTGWNVRRVFEHHGLDGLLDAVTLSYEVGAVKPSATIFRAACESIGVDPSATIMVGDDPVADAGAVAVGMRTVLLPAAPMGVDNGIALVL